VLLIEARLAVMEEVKGLVKFATQRLVMLAVTKEHVSPSRYDIFAFLKLTLSEIRLKDHRPHAFM
jgi:hypothetical protein